MGGGLREEGRWGISLTDLFVGEGTEVLVVLLARGVPQDEFDGLAVNHRLGDIVAKDGGDTVRRGSCCSRM